MAWYTSASIFGPLVIIGGAGHLLDKYFGTEPIITIVAVLVAFVASNILLLKRAMSITGQITEIGKQGKNYDPEEEEE